MLWPIKKPYAKTLKTMHGRVLGPMEKAVKKMMILIAALFMDLSVHCSQ